MTEQFFVEKQAVDILQTSSPPTRPIISGQTDGDKGKVKILHSYHGHRQVIGQTTLNLGMRRKQAQTSGRRLRDKRIVRVGKRRVNIDDAKTSDEHWKRRAQIQFHTFLHPWGGGSDEGRLYRERTPKNM